MRADSVGNETEAPMDDVVEIGVFAPGSEARAGIDPSNKLIDRNRDDNVVDVKM